MNELPSEAQKVKIEENSCKRFCRSYGHIIIIIVFVISVILFIVYVALGGLNLGNYD